MVNFSSVAVIGAGAYGTALADVAARAGREVVLYARSAAAAEQMQITRESPRLPGVAIDLVQALGSATFRPYHSTDVRGVEIGGAAKNVLAIAAGIVAGRKLGASALAALTTRGFSELLRLGRACGARSETLSGLSGLGDLILSCSSAQSRNFSLGAALGRGEQPARDRLAEGEFTAPVLVELAASRHIDMPVANAVAAILSGAATIDQAIEGLLTRPFKAEGY